MKLLFLYGPPAVGKLTIATELASITNYKLFHNHLTQDVARSVHPEYNHNRIKLAAKLRLEVFKFAAENNIDLVFTHAYSNNDHETDFIESTVDIVKSCGGEVCFISLSAPVDTLLNRVTNQSRKKYHKIHDKSRLLECMPEYEIIESDVCKDAFRIDTSQYEPKEIVQKIISFFALNEK